jgi:hypothetical protein
MRPPQGNARRIHAICRGGTPEAWAVATSSRMALSHWLDRGASFLKPSFKKRILRSSERGSTPSRLDPLYEWNTIYAVRSNVSSKVAQLMASRPTEATKSSGAMGSSTMSDPDREGLSESEIVRRRDEALARLLKMPPKPHEDMKLGRPRRLDRSATERKLADKPGSSAAQPCTQGSRK